MACKYIVACSSQWCELCSQSGASLCCCQVFEQQLRACNVLLKSVRMFVCSLSLHRHMHTHNPCMSSHKQQHKCMSESHEHMHLSATCWDLLYRHHCEGAMENVT